MVIVQKEGITWNFLNVLGVGILFYFVFYALNRWVAPLGISPIKQAIADAATSRRSDYIRIPINARQDIPAGYQQCCTVGGYNIYAKNCNLDAVQKFCQGSL